MNDSKRICRWPLMYALVAVPVFSWLIGCQRAVDESRDGSLLDAVASQSSVTLEEEILVPDGTTDELFQFMVDLERQELEDMAVARGETAQPYQTALARVMVARVKACDKILAADDGRPARVAASRMKLTALRTLSMLHSEGDRNAHQVFAAELNASGDAELQRLVVISEFEGKLTEFLSAADADATDFLKQLETFLSLPDAGADVYEAARYAAGVLFQSGKVTLSADVLQRLSERFRDHEDPTLAANATSIAGEAIQLRISQQVDAALQGDADSVASLIQSLQQGLNDLSKRDDVMTFGLQAALALESRGEFDMAQQVYRVVEHEYRNEANPDLTQSLKRSVQMANQRLDLLGKPLLVDGVSLDGKPFDWQSYRGHHVVICFWTSWYADWEAEVYHLRQAVAPYRDQGLKIVTINLDDDRNALERCLQESPLTLPIIVDPDPNATGFENPNAIRCGVEAVPFVLLVDPQGVVVDIHSRGARLSEVLEQQFHPADAARIKPLAARLRYVAYTLPDDEVDSPEQKTDVKDADQPNLETQLQQTNPYAAPAEASPLELIDFILEMQDKPRSIQYRQGFTAGVVEAADRLLASDAKERWKTIAVLAKTKYLHRDASLGDSDAEQKLRQTVEQWQDDPRDEIANEITFLRLELRALKADELPAEQLPQLLEDLITFFEKQTLSARHLRIASQSVHAVNLLDADQREPYFQRLGKQFANSADTQLAAYGNRVAQSSSSSSDHLNEVLELTGVTTDGTRFDWDVYRGQWVVVDFWATWCGPCRRAMPALRELAKQHQDQGLQVVGVSLDEDLKAVAEFLAKEELPWANIAGAEAGEIAKKYGVLAIPNLMLIDAEGRIRFVSHKVDEIAERVATELGSGT